MQAIDRQQEHRHGLKGIRRLWPAILILPLLLTLAGCGGQSADPDCSGNVAVVDGTGIAAWQYKIFLRSTLGFFEYGSAGSRYFDRNICGSASLRPECSAIKRSLRERMIVQQIVSRYGASHHITPLAADWNRALKKEQTVIKRAGGMAAFLAYLAKIKTDEAQFNYVESQEIETTKVENAIGRSRFRHWLQIQEKTQKIVRCALP